MNGLKRMVALKNRESAESFAKKMYLETLRQMVLGLNLGRHEISVKPKLNSRQKYKGQSFNAKNREEGYDWPGFAFSMAGNKRLKSVRTLLESVFRDSVEGDVMETGVWRGGMSIFIRGVMRVHGQQHRKSYVCDSFRGLPPSTLLAEKNVSWDNTPYLEVSDESVKSHFEWLGLHDPNIVFVKGFFSMTMPQLKAQRGAGGKFALLRLDGDMYESTVVRLFL